MRKDSFLAVCHTDVHPSSLPLVCPAVWLGWFVCCSAPVALFAPFLSILLSALFVHLPGTYYVEAQSSPRCLKNGDKVLISMPICKPCSKSHFLPFAYFSLFHRFFHFLVDFILFIFLVFLLCGIIVCDVVRFNAAFFIFKI